MENKPTPRTRAQKRREDVWIVQFKAIGWLNSRTYTGAYSTRKEARALLKDDWEENSDMKYRVVRYSPATD
jgi:hypothetical protein